LRAIHIQNDANDFIFIRVDDCHAVVLRFGDEQSTTTQVHLHLIESTALFFEEKLGIRRSGASIWTELAKQMNALTTESSNVMDFMTRPLGWRAIIDR